MTPTKRRSIFADKLAEFADVASGDDAVFARRGTWREWFARRVDAFNGRVVLEIGCADAVSLCAMAASHPQIGFVGLDWKFRQVYLGAERATSLGLHNVALLRARAQDLAWMFSPEEVDEILIFHPEPCDRPEEVKNRLLAAPFLLQAHHVLSGGGSIAIKTDHADYFGSVLESLNAEQLRGRFETIASSADYWNDQAVLAHTKDRCFAGSVTMFEDRFRRKRKPIHYLELRKLPASTSR